MSAHVPGWPLAIFRIAFGVLYVDMALGKAPWVRDQAGRPFGWLAGFIETEIANPTFPVVATLLREVVLPNLGLFGLLTFLIELGLGAALVLGLLTRLVGLGGFLWQVNIAVQAFNVPGEWGWIWVLLALPQFCFAACGAGRVWGLDAWLGPALETRTRAGAGWARLVGRAT